MHRYTMVFITVNALHVSGVSSAHHQELKTVYTASGICRPRQIPDAVYTEGSKKLRFPDFMTTAQDGGKIVSPTQRPPLPPGNKPGTHFC
jgi:hypothetical protein